MSFSISLSHSFYKRVNVLARILSSIKIPVTQKLASAPSDWAFIIIIVARIFQALASFSAPLQNT